MFDDLTSYFYDNVVTSFEEYRNAKSSRTAGRHRDIRLAVVAATALYHFREHLPTLHTLTRAAISAQCEDYDLLGDVVNATKHRSLRRGTPKITNATQIYEEVVVTEYEDSQGFYRGVDKKVIVKLSNGSEKDVLDVLMNVINFWYSFLHSIGVIANPQTYTPALPAEPRQRWECAEDNLDLEMVRGRRWQQRWRFQKFNYTTGRIEPRDLTGQKVVFSVYPQAPPTVTLSLRNSATGQEFNEIVTLNEDERRELSLLTTEIEKQSYIEHLPRVQQCLHELANQAGIKADEKHSRKKDDGPASSPL